MKIGVMSDTHGSLTYFEKALDVLSDCDVLIHGGDILYHGPRNDIPEGYNPKGLISKINSLDNIIIARGNCDADVDQMVINHPIQSPYVMSQFGETRIVTTHGYTDSKEDKLNRIDLKIKELLEYNKLEDITILTTNENTGVDIVKFFMDKGIKVSHVYDMNKKKNEKNRRNEKWKFRGGTGRLKVCSYHSYKGWQTPNIILVLDSCRSENIVDIRKNVGNAIFISMSRVKPNSMNGQFSFTCFNYLPEYNFLEKLF